ncbi:MAG TPA: tRNA (adenosine(37)-N6)-threonylcarbamoyltransferase complex transferase subunit TsaD [Candidatus Paceibacterota bacterium]
MKILAIETSCDETAISLLETSDGKFFDVLAHEVSSQIDVHKEWGGVVPMIAKREHLINLPVMLEKIAPKNVDLITVTYGPGLEPALWTGIKFAQELAIKWGVPIVPTDHMHGHVVSAMLKRMDDGKWQMVNVEFPAIALLISGAHTQLVLMNDADAFKLLGATRDDAVGEAFDKVARMMGLPYPGGPEISKLAGKRVQSQGEASGLTRGLAFEPKLPRPMIHSKDLDFSFSGLKTAVLYLVKNLKETSPDHELSAEQKIEIAHEFEQSVTEVLIKKTSDAINEYGAKSLLVGGGVVANKTIRETLTKLQGSTLKLYLPDQKFTGDNATMIGIAGYLRSKAGTVSTLSPNTEAFENLKATGNLSLYK